jgi:mono/diheme cytochrome c family protein
MNRKRVAVAAVASAVLVVGAVAFVSTGAYNVAATEPHGRFTHWLLHTAMERSVRRRADEVPAPRQVDSAMLLHGLEEYHAMCVACHGAPGIERGELGKGLNPEPPDLAEESAEWTDRELFWIVKHGIKLTGMPAFGVTHSDQELWGIVAFLRRLQYMSADEYRRLAADADARNGRHGAGTHVVTHSAGAVSHATTPGDQSRMDHSRMAGTGRPHAGVQPPSHQAMARMDHAGMPHRRGVAERAAAEPAHVDTGATQKLKALASELIHDPVVIARIRSDSALRRRWEDENVRKRLTTPPR